MEFVSVYRQTIYADTSSEWSDDSIVQPSTMVEGKSLAYLTPRPSH